MNKLKRTEIFTRLRNENPNPETELEYSSPFELLVAVVLSAKEYIKTIGLFNTKAKNVIKLCKSLIDLHGSEVPDDRKALEALAGVGRKTANVVLNTAFGHPVMAVDTHIFRVSNRTKIAPGKTGDEVEQRLVRLIPKEFLLDAHHWLILHGRYTCVARKPKCGSCIIEDLCEYKDKVEID